MSLPRANLTGLSPAMRWALIACLETGRLNAERRGWRAAIGEAIFPHATVDGLIARQLVVTVRQSQRRAYVRLTGRGTLYARTALAVRSAGGYSACEQR